jgi:hypothetical protein
VVSLSGDLQCQVEEAADGRGLFSHAGHHSVVDLVEENGHREDHGGPNNRQTLEDLFPTRGDGQGTAPADHRVQFSGLSVDMRPGKESESRVVSGVFSDEELASLDIGTEVSVTELHSLGTTGRSAGVNDCTNIFGRNIRNNRNWSFVLHFFEPTRNRERKRKTREKKND